MARSTTIPAAALMRLASTPQAPVLIDLCTFDTLNAGLGATAPALEALCPAVRSGDSDHPSSRSKSQMRERITSINQVPMHACSVIWQWRLAAARDLAKARTTTGSQVAPREHA